MESTERDVEPTTERDEEPTERTEDPLDRNECSNANNEKPTKCKPIEPKTCKNMHNYKLERTGKCMEGCMCKDGYVLDEELNECIEPKQCSCENDGNKYHFDDQIQRDCNTCICQSGEWFCSNRVCQTEKNEGNPIDMEVDEIQPNQGKNDPFNLLI